MIENKRYDTEQNAIDEMYSGRTTVPNILITTKLLEKSDVSMILNTAFAANISAHRVRYETNFLDGECSATK